MWTRKKLNIEDPKILKPTEQKLFTSAIWNHGFAKPCATAMLDSVKDVKTLGPIMEFSFTILYILESNPHPFYSFRGLKNQMRIRIACGLYSRSWDGFWKNDRAAARVVRTIQYNNLLFYLLFIIYYIIFIIYYLSDSPSSLITESLSVTQSLSSAAVRLYRWQLNGHFTLGALAG